MVEKAVIDQRVQNLATSATKLSKISKNVAPFGYRQIDHVLKKIRLKMGVNHISNIESEKASFESDDPNVLSFGKWLALNILLQSIWNQIKQENESKVEFKGSSKGSEFSIETGAHHKVLAYVAEENYWTISALVDEFTEEIVNNKVLSRMNGISFINSLNKIHNSTILVLSLH